MFRGMMSLAVLTAALFSIGCGSSKPTSTEAEKKGMSTDMVVDMEEQQLLSTFPGPDFGHDVRDHVAMLFEVGEDLGRQELQVIKVEIRGELGVDELHEALEEETQSRLKELVLRDFLVLVERLGWCVLWNRHGTSYRA